MSEIAILNLSGPLSVDWVAPYELIVAVGPDFDLNGTLYAQVRKFAYSSPVLATFTTSILIAQRQLSLVLPKTEVKKLKPGEYKWDALMVYPISELRPAGWEEYLFGGDLQVVPRSTQVSVEVTP